MATAQVEFVSSALNSREGTKQPPNGGLQPVSEGHWCCEKEESLLPVWPAGKDGYIGHWGVFALPEQLQPQKTPCE